MTYRDLKRLAHDVGLTRAEAASLRGLTERELSAEIKRLDPGGTIAWPGELIEEPPRPRQIAGFAVPATRGA
ncbi:hypothetical protein [Thioalkalivibrio sp. ALE12]|uniref:hypothetical protein n=1 Tax=Thioalkalivibrio sp. ALE12 TaxID=1158170 RepID=UPI00037246EF|nr:hypothetical protein [Thioalkalivibrio sp. ALE12]